jgi:glycosyltransferase involved in cell wall biosynthesis
MSEPRAWRGTVLSLFGVQPIRVGGVECFCREQARQLAQHGWRSIVVFAAPPVPAVAEYLREPNLLIEVAPRLDQSRFDCVPGICRLLDRYTPQIVHLNFLSFLGPYPWLARIYGARQVFITDHGSRPADYEASLAPAWKRLAARVINDPVTGVFSVSEYNRQTALAVGYIEPAIAHRLYESIELPPLEGREAAGAAFRERFAIPQERELVMQVSWVIPEKGIPDFLEAARLVLCERPRTHFAVVGSGPHAETYRREAIEMGLGESLTWTGLIDNPVAEGAYAAADVFCLASRWNEAFGWVIAEAMSFERPVVATRKGGIPEIVTDGVTGFLVASHNPVELAGRILTLLRDPELRRRMGAAARQEVAARFELKQTVAQLLRHYDLS